MRASNKLTIFASQLILIQSMFQSIHGAGVEIDNVTDASVANVANAAVAPLESEAPLLVPRKGSLRRHYDDHVSSRHQPHQRQQEEDNEDYEDYEEYPVFNSEIDALEEEISESLLAQIQQRENLLHPMDDESEIQAPFRSMEYFIANSQDQSSRSSSRRQQRQQQQQQQQRRRETQQTQQAEQRNSKSHLREGGNHSVKGQQEESQEVRRERELKQQFEFGARVIGGNEAEPYRFSYTVSLQDSYGHFCGGTLVAKDVVLTAAHCTRKVMDGGASGGEYAEFTRVVIGRHDLTYADDGEELQVRKELIHPLYDPENAEYDFALLILKRPTMSKTAPVVMLNSDSLRPEGRESVTVLGWGDVDPDEYVLRRSDVLQRVELRVVDNEDCEQSKGSVNDGMGKQSVSYSGYITGAMLCARAKRKDSCQGDSGGPLVVEGKTAYQDYQVGVVSWGVGCANRQFPGVYSRISSVYPWLRRRVCERSIFPPRYLQCASVVSTYSTYSRPRKNNNEQKKRYIDNRRNEPW